jgi:hypothetical protein
MERQTAETEISVALDLVLNVRSLIMLQQQAGK